LARCSAVSADCAVQCSAVVCSVPVWADPARCWLLLAAAFAAIAVLLLELAGAAWFVARGAGCGPLRQKTCQLPPMASFRARGQIDFERQDRSAASAWQQGLSLTHRPAEIGLARPPLPPACRTRQIGQNCPIDNSASQPPKVFERPLLALPSLRAASPKKLVVHTL
jgi:hypothetical protein